MASEPETPGPTDEELDRAGGRDAAVADGDRDRLASGRRSPLAAMPGGARSARWCTACSSTPTRRRRPRRRAVRALAAGAWRASTLESATDDASSTALASPIETPLGPLAGDLRLRDIAAPTGSTS